MARVLQLSADAHRTNHNRILPSTSAEKKEIWSTLLSDVSSTKKVPEKRILLFGGSQDSQREFIDSIAPEQPTTQSRRQDRSWNRKIPLANRFALGYTYRDVYDVDGEDALARISFYTLNEPSPAYAPLLSRLLSTASTIPHTSVVILLDWSAPWDFLRLLRDWIRLVKRSLVAADRGSLEDNDARWKVWRDASPGGTAEEDGEGASVPLGPGEFDEPLGLLLVVVCQNTHAVEKLEKEAGYKEADFDFVLQFLRTVGLKHGAGLAYTMPSQPGQVRALMYKVLRVGEGEGQGKAGELKHNAIDRDRVFVPPGWDSWGKIRVLREGFDIEGVSRMWSVDIENGETRQQEDETDGQIPQSTETMYAARISNPKPISAPPPTLEVLHSSDQEFLTEQMARLEVFLAEDAAAKKEQRPTASTRRVGDESGSGASIGERIGPVQFNMGGIQYDADEALRRIKERTKAATAQPTTSSTATPERARATRDSTPFTPGSPPTFEPGKDIPVENLEAYFASLIRGGGGRSAANSPRVGASPRVIAKGSNAGEQGKKSPET